MARGKSDGAWIDYRGERFRLTKSYADYDDYKEDPDNLDPAETERVGRAVRGAEVAPTYPSREAMSSAASDLKFPGYGMAQFGERPQTDGSVLCGYSVEVPRAGEMRVLVFCGVGGSYVLIDDFVTPQPDDANDEIMGVARRGEFLVYATFDGRELLARPSPGR